MAITRWVALRAERLESRQTLGSVTVDESVLETLSELATAPRHTAAGDGLLLVALESVPPEYAEVLRYHLLHGLPHRKIAKFLGIPLLTVKWRYFRGKEILRCILVPGPSCAAARKGCAPFSTIARLERLDVRTTSWMAGHGIQVLRISLGVIFFWFGVLKFFPGLSPAQELATRTISGLTLGLVPPDVSIIVLGIWECVIGLGLIFGMFLRTTLVLLFLQMLGTFSPLVLFPHELFTHFPNAPTLEGQYIIKNLVLISAGLVIGGTVRGGAIEADPEVIQLGRQTQMRVQEA